MSRGFVDNSWPEPGEITAGLADQLTLARSWYRVRRVENGWIVEEHRVGEHNEVREHRCGTHAEVNRVRMRLSAEGLIGYGEAV